MGRGGGGTEPEAEVWVGGVEELEASSSSSRLMPLGLGAVMGPGGGGLR